MSLAGTTLYPASILRIFAAFGGKDYFVLSDTTISLVGATAIVIGESITVDLPSPTIDSIGSFALPAGSCNGTAGLSGSQVSNPAERFIGAAPSVLLGIWTLSKDYYLGHRDDIPCIMRIKNRSSPPTNQIVLDV